MRAPAVSLCAMKTRLAASLAVAALVLTGCTKSAAPQDSVSQPTDQLNQTVDADPAADNMVAQCSSGTPVTGRPLRVVTSVAPVTSLVGQMVAGTDVKVEGIVPESANSHTYSLTPADLEKLAGADVVIAVGLAMERDFLDAAKSAMQDGAVLCELGTASIQKSDYLHDGTFTQESGTPNPHVWLNPQLALRFMNHARDAVTARAATVADAVDANYVALSRQAMELDTAMKAAVETVPVRNRTLHMFHDSLAYFASHFKFEIGLAFQAPGFTEPTPVEVADAVATIAGDKAPAFFGNTEFPGAFHDENEAATGTKVTMISDEDLPGAPGGADHSFGGLLRETFTRIVTALGGDPSALSKVDVAAVAGDRASYPQ